MPRAALRRIGWLALWAVTSTVAWASPVRIPSGEHRLTGELQGGGPRCVVLVHGPEGRASTWAPLQERLDRAGLRVLTVDLPGHGETAGDPSERAWAGHLVQVVRFLGGKGCQRVALVGVEGTGLAALAASEESLVDRVALVGPRLAVDGLLASHALATLGRRPLFLVHAASDEKGARAARALAARAQGPHETHVATQGEAGPAFFERSPVLDSALTAWLTAPAPGEGQPADALSSGDVGEMETTGTRYGE